MTNRKDMTYRERLTETHKKFASNYMHEIFYGENIALAERLGIADRVYRTVDYGTRVRFMLGMYKNFLGLMAANPVGPLVVMMMLIFLLSPFYWIWLRVVN